MYANVNLADNKQKPIEYLKFSHECNVLLVAYQLDTNQKRILVYQIGEFKKAIASDEVKSTVSDPITFVSLDAEIYNRVTSQHVLACTFGNKTPFHSKLAVKTNIVRTRSVKDDLYSTFGVDTKKYQKDQRTFNSNIVFCYSDENLIYFID